MKKITRTQRHKAEIVKLHKAVVERGDALSSKSTDYLSGVIDALSWVLGDDFEEMNSLAGIKAAPVEEQSNPQKGLPKP